MKCEGTQCNHAECNVVSFEFVNESVIGRNGETG